MGRTIDEKKMSKTEKQERYCEKQDQEVRREKYRIRKATSSENLKKDSEIQKLFKATGCRSHDLEK